jgi:DNA-binding PadR family transcriptional regulator
VTRDGSLIPTDAIRLAALGSLAERPRSYSQLATEIRQFSSRIVGPSLDMMGSSLELLGVEGLIEREAGSRHDEPPLRITDSGRVELRRLLGTSLKGPIGELGKLFITLKMRFLHLLEPTEQRAELDLLIAASASEIERIAELRRQFADGTGHLIDWLDFDRSEGEARLAWFRNLRERL